MIFLSPFCSQLIRSMVPEDSVCRCVKENMLTFWIKLSQKATTFASFYSSMYWICCHSLCLGFIPVCPGVLVCLHAINKLTCLPTSDGIYQWGEVQVGEWRVRGVDLPAPAPSLLSSDLPPAFLHQPSGSWP